MNITCVYLFSCCLLVINNLFLIYYLYHLIHLDVTNLGMKKPNFWAFLAIGDQQGGGLIWYLLKRQKFVSKQLPTKQVGQLKQKIYCLLMIDILCFFLIIAALIKFS
jgi:hypothetical protein